MPNKISAALAAAVLLVLSANPSKAQDMAVSANFGAAADYGTMSLETSLAVSKHWNLSAGVKYNPFSFSKEGQEGALRRRQRSFSAGVRYWPWHVYSGWWMASKLQFQEYNIAGTSGPGSSEGDRIGAALSAGYSYMISKWLNIELGLGFWGGYDIYRLYDCPTCGITVEKGKRFFLKMEDIILALSIIF